MVSREENGNGKKVLVLTQKKSKPNPRNGKSIFGNKKMGSVGERSPFILSDKELEALYPS